MAAADPDLKPLLILGGLALGVVALLAYTTPAKSQVNVNPGPLPPARRPPGDLPPPPSSAYDEAIAAAIAAAQAAATANPAGGGVDFPPAIEGLPLPNPAPLSQGQRYRARLELSGLETLASRDMIKAQFEGIGFSNVTAYMSQAELPPGFPPAALANITSGSRWAEGTWAQASQLLAKPPQIQNAFLA